MDQLAATARRDACPPRRLIRAARPRLVELGWGRWRCVRDGGDGWSAVRLAADADLVREEVRTIRDTLNGRAVLTVDLGLRQQAIVERLGGSQSPRQQASLRAGPPASGARPPVYSGGITVGAAPAVQRKTKPAPARNPSMRQRSRSQS